MATWYMSWHVAICLSVVSLPSKLFRLDVDSHDLTPSPDWGRLTILLLWYLAGIPTAYVMQGPCSAEAPGTWGRAIRVLIEGVVAFGLAGCIYLDESNRGFVTLGLSGSRAVSASSSTTFANGGIAIPSREEVTCSIRD
ncbi:hypothetical protein BJY52DRAFT_1223686 [Lactarius psammicola]|nr:hypothetical protein BJY52DRAFT_1223686 [Lactarius psammicola]